MEQYTKMFISSKKQRMLQNLEFSRQTCEHKKYESKCASTNFNKEYSQKNNPMKIFPLQCKIVRIFQSEPA